MREFQRQCVAALQPALDVLEVTPRWRTVECKPDESVGHVPGDVYCQTKFEHAGHIYDLYVYTDEAGADVDGQWFIYERPDCQCDDARLTSAFTRFIERCLSGTPAKEAYKTGLDAQ